jgi:hypothetical protein
MSAFGTKQTNYEGSDNVRFGGKTDVDQASTPRQLLTRTRSCSLWQPPYKHEILAPGAEASRLAIFAAAARR